MAYTKKFWNENSDKDVSIKPRLSDRIDRKIDISEHETSSDSIEKESVFCNWI